MPRLGSYQRKDGTMYHVLSQFTDKTIVYVVIRTAGEGPIASYDKQWQAENHAINGCPCPQNWHYYGLKCQSELDRKGETQCKK